MCEKTPLSTNELRLLEFFEGGVKAGKRLHQFEKYAIDTFRIPQALRKVADGRKDPDIPTFRVILSLLHAAVLRIPSLNALEEELATSEFQRFMGLPVKEGQKAFSADTIADVLDTLSINQLESIIVNMIKTGERNKAFRDDLFGTFRCVALDGWEPFCSYKRHCKACLTRKVKIKVKDDDGNEIEKRVTQYYHRFVVAFMIAPKLDLTLAIEPIRSSDLREDLGVKEARHEGELTAAGRLIDKLHRQYGRFINAFALDGLYPCGPIFEKLTQYNYGAFVVVKDKRKDPYRFADEIWRMLDAPPIIQQDPVTKEKVEFWELKDVDALQSFDGSVDMLKAVVTRKKGKKSTWTMALLGKAKKAGRLTSLRIIRSRWHIENTAFHQWVTKWNFEHVYRHTPNAVTAVMLIWSIAFNLMQFFFYRRLRKARYGRKVTDTISALIRRMNRDVGQFPKSIPWCLLDTG